MLRSSVMALAALLLAVALAPAPAWPADISAAVGTGNGISTAAGSWSPRLPVLHEYAAYNPNCAFLRRVVPTPLGPQWQLVPVCF